MQVILLLALMAIFWALCVGVATAAAVIGTAIGVVVVVGLLLYGLKELVVSWFRK